MNSAKCITRGKGPNTIYEIVYETTLTKKEFKNLIRESYDVTVKMGINPPRPTTLDLLFTYLILAPLALFGLLCTYILVPLGLVCWIIIFIIKFLNLFGIGPILPPLLGF